jgi:hypothetical protein
MDERPGDYVEAPREAVPGTNRGINTNIDVPATGVRRKFVPETAQADTDPVLGKISASGFGNAFPANPQKGDTYLRTDSLPNRLFKFNDYKWIEVDKNSTDVYAYDELYIQHLINEIEAGRYDTDTLTNVERDQIAEYLGKNVQ